MRSWIFIAALMAASVQAADEKTALERGDYGPLDKAPTTALYDYPVQVSEHVYSAIGATQPPTYENAGHNNNQWNEQFKKRCERKTFLRLGQALST